MKRHREGRPSDAGEGLIFHSTAGRVNRIGAALDPADITYTVTAKGDGDNRLRVGCGQQFIAIRGQIHDSYISPGQSATRSFQTDIDATTPATDGKQDVRIRLSRDIQ